LPVLYFTGYWNTQLRERKARRSYQTVHSIQPLMAREQSHQVGVTTVDDIRRAGGRVTFDGHPGNPNHATLDGLTPEQLEELFSPTIPNPNRSR
jgi:hypothetical protein